MYVGGADLSGGMAELNVMISPTQSEIMKRQREAIDKAKSMASNIEGVSGPDQALVREMLPSDDLESGADNNWNAANNEWLQDGLTQDAENVVYNINSTGAAQSKVFVFYGAANVASTVLTTEVIFQDGTGAQFADFNTQVLEIVELSDVVLFDQDIVFGATDDGDLVQWANAAGNDSMVYLCKVAEPLGETLSSRESPSTRQGGGGRTSSRPR